MATPANTYNQTSYNQTIIENDVQGEILTSTVIAATAFLGYAYLLTLSREVNYIWTGPRRPASWIYGFIRYPALVSYTINMSLNSYTPNCNAVSGLANWTQTMSLVAFYIFQILRTYAVCGRSLLLVGILVLTIFPAVVLAMMQSVWAICTPIGSFTNAENNLQIASDTLFECIVFVATVWGTWSQAQLARQSSATGQSISSSLLRNGSLYFGIFLAMQIWVLVTTEVPQTPHAINIGEFPNILSFPVRLTLSSQFLLELRERSAKTTNMSSTANERSTMSAFHATVHFVNAAIEDDFGESLVVDAALGEDSEMRDDEDGRDGGRAAVERTRAFRLREDIELRERYLAGGDDRHADSRS